MMFVVNAARTVPLVALTIIVFSSAGWFLEGKFKRAEHRMKELKSKTKDVKL